MATVCGKCASRAKPSLSVYVGDIAIMGRNHAGTACVMFLYLGFPGSLALCPPCHSREVHSGDRTRSCTASSGECKFIDMCQLDPGASSVVVVPVTVQCLDDTTAFSEASLKSGVTPDLTTVPLALRTASSLAALRTVVSSTSRTGPFTSGPGVITSVGSTGTPRTIVRNFPHFTIFDVGFIPSSDVLLGGFRMLRNRDEMILRPSAASGSVLLQKPMHHCIGAPPSAACFAYSPSPIGIEQDLATTTAYSVTALTAAIEFLGFVAAAPPTTYTACFELSPQSLLTFAQNVLPVLVLRYEETTVVTPPVLAGDPARPAMCYQVLDYHGNDPSEFGVHVVAPGSIKQFIIGSGVTGVHLGTTPGVQVVFSEFTQLRGTPAKAILVEIGGTEHEVDLAAVPPDAQGVPHTGLTYVPSYYYIRYSGLTNGAARTVHSAMGIPMTGPSCLSVACPARHTAIVVECPLTGCSVVDCCQPVTMASVTFVSVLPARDSVAVPFLVDPITLAPGWMYRLTPTHLEYTQIVANVPDLVSVSGTAEVVIISGGSALAFGTPGTWRLSTEVDHCFSAVPTETYDLPRGSGLRALQPAGTIPGAQRVRIVTMRGRTVEMCVGREVTPPLTPHAHDACPSQLIVSERCMLGSEPTANSFFPHDVFLPMIRKSRVKGLLTTADDADPEEPQELLKALRCAYSASFVPWSDMLGGTQLQSVVQELAMSEEAMAADETPFSATYSLTLLTAELATHGSHLAFGIDVPRPSDLDDSFLKDHADLIYSSGGDLRIARTVFSQEGETWLRDGLRFLAQGTHVGGVHNDLPGTYCLFDISRSYTVEDPALIGRVSGETIDTLCRSYNLRHGAKSTSPDLLALAMSYTCRSSVGLISNLASTGQALTAVVPTSADYRRLSHAIQPMVASYLALTASYGCVYLLGGFTWIPASLLLFHNFLYADVTLNARRPVSGLVVAQARMSTLFSWYRDPKLDGTKFAFMAGMMASTVVLAYSVFMVVEERLLLPFAGPVLAQLIVVVSFASAGSWLSVYVQFAGFVAILVTMLAYETKYIVSQDSSGAKRITLASASQAFNFGMIVLSLCAVASSPGMTRYRRGILTVATVSGFAPGGIVVGLTMANVLIGSGYVLCSLADANLLAVAYKMVQAVCLLVWLYLSTPFAPKLKKAGVTLYVPWYVLVAAALKAGDTTAVTVARALAPEVCAFITTFTVVPEGLQRCDRLTEDQLSKLYSMLERLTPASAFAGMDGPFGVMSSNVCQLLDAMDAATDTEAFSSVFSSPDVVDKFLQARLGPNPARCSVDSAGKPCPASAHSLDSDTTGYHNVLAQQLQTDAALNRKLLGLGADHAVSDRQVIQAAEALAKTHTLRVGPPVNSDLSACTPAEADAIYSTVSQAAKVVGISLPARTEMRVAPSATACCCLADVFGSLTGDRDGKQALSKQAKAVPPRVVLLHSFYNHKGGTPTPTFGFATVGGQPGYFATISWSASDEVAHCPLGSSSKSDVRIPDAVGLLVTGRCYLQSSCRLTSADKHGSLIFDGVNCQTLPDCTVELTSDVVTVHKTASHLSAAGYSNGLVFFLAGGSFHPVLCQGQRDVKNQVNTFVTPRKVVGPAVFFYPLGVANPLADQLLLRAVRERSRSVPFSMETPLTRLGQLALDFPPARAFSDIADAVVGSNNVGTEAITRSNLVHNGIITCLGAVICAMAAWTELLICCPLILLLLLLAPGARAGLPVELPVSPDVTVFFLCIFVCTIIPHRKLAYFTVFSLTSLCVGAHDSRCSWREQSQCLPE